MLRFPRFGRRVSSSEFWSGVGSVLDIGATRTRANLPRQWYGRDADRRALLRDEREVIHGRAAVARRLRKSVAHRLAAAERTDGRTE